MIFDKSEENVRTSVKIKNLFDGFLRLEVATPAFFSST